MEPARTFHDFSDEPPVRIAAASVHLSSDEDDDDELLSAAPAGEGVADVWAGVQPPADDGDLDPLTEPFAFETAAPVAEEEPRMASIPDPEKAVAEQVPALPERGGWIVSLLCAGIAIVAVCLLLPLAEENHQLAWQREKLKTDLTQLQQQVEINDQFLKKLTEDPTLAERLAQRQMKFIRKGTTILDLPDGGKEEMSPFQLVTLPPPNPIPAYQPLGGALSAVVRNPHLRLYLAGTGLMLLAAGLVLGGDGRGVEDGQ
jgi:cell division protein FtsB